MLNEYFLSFKKQLVKVVSQKESHFHLFMPLNQKGKITQHQAQRQNIPQQQVPASPAAHLLKGKTADPASKQRWYIGLWSGVGQLCHTPQARHRRITTPDQRHSFHASDFKVSPAPSSGLNVATSTKRQKSY